ncbi:tellurite resistance TerB family protein [Muricoccus radiodurans]|uniref:tellurite resistance TerB family protein n=1 Tax=Muricoccus radiodurans TaxID=2231721 RepID=UPI003CF87A05
MFDTKRLLEGFLGGNAPRGSAPGASPWGASSGGSLQDMLGGLLRGGGGGMSGGLGGLLGGLRPPLGGAVGSAAAGGLLGSLLGGRRSGAGGGLLRMGGLAVLGMLAHRAYTQWQQGQSAQPSATPAATPQAQSAWQNPTGYARPASSPAPSPANAAAAEAAFADDESPDLDGHPFALTLVRAMVAAAKADGHLDQEERDRIFQEVERLNLDPEAKSFVFQALEGPADPIAIAAGARTEAQKTKLYLASRLVAEPDTAAERAYLDALAHHLGLDPGLRRSLDDQAAEAARLAAGGSAPTA